MMSNPLEFTVMAALLRQGRVLLLLSLVLLACALLAKALSLDMRFWPWLVSLIAALVQAYYAMRVGLDAQLFDALSRDADPATARARLDAALQATGLRRDTTTDRSWASRFAGARGLLLRQVVCVAIQAVALVGSCL